ncbi:uncharacterized protein SPPG_08143 [Spizellomyces punctatus DAOM BR117]|uniref:Kinesin motor domain-containing protein n=1 Tax=Spizellomyces punctatus (strain DAOM BR117) TaxID=645134 RepID=A0A0L0H6M7_SPIPD|nr:uncharacterized protein SPPG_08143 [Spizellomyces punctatus DAOM BR117]KNC96556.1 hypothetical protein SPPG_08143 [Spizellomyces punctatus DAOM BR117]|eukprot:XP_016604596.1 hypothetical protein SPPG_08143 [Spizellomyces punctatus DAOM BR117]
MASTSVKVALRVRPLNAKEVLANAQECISFMGVGIPQVTIGPTGGGGADTSFGFSTSMASLPQHQQKAFTFDHVFDTASTQEEVYRDCVKPLVDRFLEGFNATVLAYGQTGSGKTYSMGTGLEAVADPEHQGIVPRSIYHLFDRLQAQAAASPEGFKYEVLVSFLELYNEELVDLLNARPKEGTTGWGGLSIREDGAGKIMWYGVKEQAVSSPEELLSVLEKGSLCRTTGSTDMNASSSRSHAIFSVILKQQKWVPRSTAEEDGDGASGESPLEEITKQEGEEHFTPTSVDPTTHPDGSFQHLLSKFHFVDLAGSERLKRTNAEGDRKKEGISINQGLLALGNVISALGDDTRKSAHVHVPYRDSKLTRMLQDSLGGNSQTLMLACVSPSDTNYGETVNTLNYANRARNIKNKVVINQEWAGGGNTLALEREVRILRATVAQLKADIQDGGPGGSLRVSTTGGDAFDASYLANQRQTVSGTLRERELQMRIQRERELDAEMDRTKRERDAIRFENERLKFRCFRLQDRCRELGRELADTIVQRDRAVVERSRMFLPGNKSMKRKGRDMEEENGGVKLRKVWGEAKGEIVRSPSTESFPERSFEVGSDEPDDTSKLIPENDPLSPEATPNLAENDSQTLQSAYKKQLTAHPIIQSYVRTISDLRFRLSEAEDKLTWYNDVVAKLGGKSKGGRNAFTAPNRGGDGRLFSAEEIGADAEADAELGIPCRPLQRQVKEVCREEEETLDEGGQERRLMKALQDNPDVDEMLKQSKSQDAGEVDGVSPGPRLYGVPRTNSVVWESSSLNVAEDFEESTALDEATDEASSTSPDSSTSDMFLVIAKIQADIAEHEKLVSRIQHRDAEYETMKTAYEQKLRDLQTQLLQSKKERDQALKRMQGGERKEEKKGTVAIKQRYEDKKRQLEKQIDEFRRKLAENTRARDERKGKDEGLMKGLKDTIASMKAEKARMLKDLKKEREKSRALEMTSQRQIAILKRKEKKAADLVKKLEQSRNQMQRLILQRRSDEIHNINRRSVMKILKRTSTPNRISKSGGSSGSMSPKRRSGTWKVSTAPIDSSRPGSSGSSSNRRAVSMYAKSTNKSSPETKLPSDIGLDDGDVPNHLPVNVRAQFKKQMLEKELASCIAVRRAQKALDELKVSRDRLVGEQRELVAERERCVRAEQEATGRFDPEKPQYMDERLGVLDHEIAMIGHRISRVEELVRRARLGGQPAGQEGLVSSSTSISSLTPDVDVGWENATNIIRSLDPYELEAIAEMCLEDLVEVRCLLEEGEVKVQERDSKIEELTENLERCRETARKAAMEFQRRLEDAREEERRRVKEQQQISFLKENAGMLRSISEPMLNAGEAKQHAVLEELVSKELWASEEVLDDRTGDDVEVFDLEEDRHPLGELTASPRSNSEQEIISASNVQGEEKKDEAVDLANMSLRDRMVWWLKGAPGGHELLRGIQASDKDGQVKDDAGKENRAEPEPSSPGRVSSAPATPKPSLAVPRTPTRERSGSTSSKAGSTTGSERGRTTRHDKPPSRDGVSSPRSVSMSASAMMAEGAGGSGTKSSSASASNAARRRRSPSWTYGKDSPRSSTTNKGNRSPSTSPKKRGYLNQAASPTRGPFRAFENDDHTVQPPPFLNVVSSSSVGGTASGRSSVAGSGGGMATHQPPPVGSRPGSGGDVFERLANAHTLASQAKVIHRGSSGVADALGGAAAGEMGAEDPGSGGFGARESVVGRVARRKISGQGAGPGGGGEEDDGGEHG